MKGARRDGYSECVAQHHIHGQFHEYNQELLARRQSLFHASRV